MGVFDFRRHCCPDSLCSYDNWKFRDCSRTLASACCLGLFLHFKVLFVFLFKFAFFPILYVKTKKCNNLVYYFLPYYSAKRLGPVMKLLVCILVALPLALWPVCVVVGSILGGLAYGFLGPVFGTFKAVSEGKTDKFRHCVIVSKH